RDVEVLLALQCVLGHCDRFAAIAFAVDGHKRSARGNRLDPLLERAHPDVLTDRDAGDRHDEPTYGLAGEVLQYVLSGALAGCECLSLFRESDIRRRDAGAERDRPTENGDLLALRLLDK